MMTAKKAFETTSLIHFDKAKKMEVENEKMSVHHTKMAGYLQEAIDVEILKSMLEGKFIAGFEIQPMYSKEAVNIAMNAFYEMGYKTSLSAGVNLYTATLHNSIFVGWSKSDLEQVEREKLVMKDKEAVLQEFLGWDKLPWYKRWFNK